MSFNTIPTPLHMTCWLIFLCFVIILYFCYILVDGSWGEWINDQACSKTCGASNTQSRLCNNPAPDNGGALCNTTDNTALANTESRTIDCGPTNCPSNKNFHTENIWTAYCFTYSPSVCCNVFSLC